jgi:F-box associated protein
MIPSLPPEVNVEILKLLSDRNVLNASQVNKAANALVKNFPDVLLSKLACKIIKGQNEMSSSYIDDVNAYEVMLHSEFLLNQQPKHKNMKTLEQNREFDKARNKVPEQIKYGKQLDVIIKVVARIAWICLFVTITDTSLPNEVRIGRSMAFLAMLGYTAWYVRTKPYYING